MRWCRDQSKGTIFNRWVLPSFLIHVMCNPGVIVSILDDTELMGRERAFLVFVPVPIGIAIWFVLVDLPSTNDSAMTLTMSIIPTFSNECHVPYLHNSLAFV